MSKFFKSHHSGTSELNITPLLDLVIVLMMIFIIAAPQLANNVELSLPSKAPPPDHPAKPPKLTYIGVDVNGEVTLNKQVYPQMEPLKQTLIAMFKEDPELSVVVRGHEDADYELVIGVLDILQQAKITRIGLATGVGDDVQSVQ